MKLEPGDIVVTVLQNPREKIVGVLEEITAAGITMRGIDLSYFDDWSRSIAAGEQHLAMSDVFIPMWRVERISRDESSGGIPSLAEQFEQRTGRLLTAF
jgi:hypothetical protein